jgi:hypothetical protein
MHLIRPNNRQSSQASILRKANPRFGNSNLYRSLRQHLDRCIHLGQAKAPRWSRIDWLFHSNHRIYHHPQPRACLGQCTLWSPLSHRLRFICRSACSLDPAFEQRLWILQDSLRHRYGNWSGQRWWVCCVVLFPVEEGSVLLDRLQDHVLAHVHGYWLNLCVCDGTLVREQAKARWEEGSSTPGGGRQLGRCPSWVHLYLLELLIIA